MAELAVLLGAVVGLVLGLTGAGGSVFAVPALMIGLGWPIVQAAPVALLAVCAAATFGTVAVWDATLVRYRAALLMSAIAMALAPLGIAVASRLSEARLGLIFAGVLLVVGVRMILQAHRAPVDTRVVRAMARGNRSLAGSPVCLTHPETGRLVWTCRCGFSIAAVGAASGFLSGLIGVGGGFVIVPALRATTSLSVHSAVATSLMAIALTSGGTVALTLALGGNFPLTIAASFAAGSLAGMLIGRKVARRVAGPLLQQGFAIAMLAAAAVLAAHATA